MSAPRSQQRCGAGRAAPTFPAFHLPSILAFVDIVGVVRSNAACLSSRIQRLRAPTPSADIVDGPLAEEQQAACLSINILDGSARPAWRRGYGGGMKTALRGSSLVNH